MADGVGPSATVPCPAATTAAGRSWRNAGGLSLGTVSLETAFARSCNTSFIHLADQHLSAHDLSAMARRFGFDADFTGLGVTWENGSAQIPDNETEVAAAAIGQSTLLASPLMMATAVSAVASGTWKPPRLVPDAPPGETHPVPGTAALREMMRSAVADGTGSATNLPGEPVHGKTGTADVGGAAPHAWFVGYRGGLGVAIVVVNGGGGGDVAAPIGADFFGALG